MKPDDNFEIHSIELCYGNDKRQVVERVALDLENSENPEDAVLLAHVEETGDRGDLSDTIHISVIDWLKRLAGLMSLHAKNQLTVDPEMYDILQQINEDENSPFKGMIQMPNEEQIVYKRDDN